MRVSSARSVAFDILLRVETTDAYASELLHSSRTNKLSPADHGLATEIVMGVQRWRSVLDDQIASHLDKPLAKLDAEVITALRMGAYQLLFLDRIPAHAAINESVELVKKARKRSAAGMVNAVLRRVAKHTENDVGSRSPQVGEGIASAMPKREPPDTTPLGAAAAKAAKISEAHSARLEAVPSRSVPNPPGLNGTQSHPPQHRSTLSSRAELRNLHLLMDENAARAHPAWLIERWDPIYGTKATQAISSYGQTTPKTVIRVDQKLIEDLANEGIQLGPGSLLRDACGVVRGDITRTRAFRERRLVIQDEGSQLVALLLGEGKLILDCCAAPGGKTRILAERNPHATVVAMELHPHRAALMSHLVPLPNVHVICADARNMPYADQFDRILVDAPCTGTGTLARNPEIKWRLTPDDISRLQAYQTEILTAAMQKLAPGGQLLYSTCSLEPEENEAVIEQALRGNPAFRLLDIRDRLTQLHKQGALVCDPDSLIRGPYLRTIPGVHPCDGFFAALIQRDM